MEELVLVLVLTDVLVGPVGVDPGAGDAGSGGGGGVGGNGGDDVGGEEWEGVVTYSSCVRTSVGGLR